MLLPGLATLILLPNHSHAVFKGDVGAGEIGYEAGGLVAWSHGPSRGAQILYESAQAMLQEKGEERSRVSWWTERQFSS